MGLTTSSTMETLQTGGSVALPVQLRNILAQEISAQAYAPSGKLPSERALAERFRVSRSSIRECLNGMVKDGALVRIVGKGTFIASEPPTGEKDVERRNFAFLIGENIFQFVQPGYTRILVGAEQTCQQFGHSLVFHSVAEEQSLLKLPLGNSRPHGISGFVVAGGLRKKILEHLLSQDIPVVLTDLIVQDENASAVGPDYASGTREALDYLASLAHARIVFIGFPNSEKYQAYWHMLESLDLRYNPHHVQFLHLPDVAPGILAGFQAMQAIIQAGDVPTAVIATNDLVAVGAIEALKLAGMAVPADVSVVGYDDLGTGMNPPLTTIRSFPEEVGRTAARMLIDRLAGRAEQSRIAIRTELVVRGTTAPPAHMATEGVRVTQTTLGDLRA